MNRIVMSFLVLTACLLVWTSGVWCEGFGSPVMDGVVDAIYGAFEAADSDTDGGGNDNMDLLNLYVCNDASYWYFCFTIDDDVATTNWGKYVIYLDTNGDSSLGATSDAWTRSVRGIAPHLPEYGLYSWVDSPPYGTDHTQFWAYDDTAGSWTMFNGLDGAALSAGDTSGLEWKIARSRIGDPDSLWCEVFSTGGGDSDNARDTSNDPPDDWNGVAGDWADTAKIALSTLVHRSVGADTTHPRVEEAVATDWTHVRVTFSEAMDSASAVNPVDYVITGLSVTAADLVAADQVLLTTTSQSYGVIYTVTVSSNVKDLAGNGMDPTADEASFIGFGIAQVTFCVIDTMDTLYAPGYKFKGSWDTNTYHAYDPSWGLGFLYDMFDDGSNGDETPGDHIWTRILDLVTDNGSNTWEWGVTDTGGIWIDGNWQFQVTDTTDQKLTYTPIALTEQAVAVVFSVDMSMVDTVKSPLIIVGSVSPLTWDFLPTNPDTLNDEGLSGDATAGDSIWTITVTFPLGSNKWVEYKYGNGAEDNDLPPFVNRVHIIDDNYSVGNPQVRPTDLFGYFLDVVPKAVDDLSATLSDGSSKSSSGDISLQWSAVTLNLNDHPVWVDRYRIYRDTAVEDAGSTLIDSTEELFYLDATGVVGDTGTHYYYSVTAVSVTKESDDSDPVGEFDRTLINAK